LKRVDFDPDGERNPQNRGISKFERISWDEATDIIAKELKRQYEKYGPGLFWFNRTAMGRRSAFTALTAVK
jgi:anaerobic selenocysteine-containing dehydrogenase